MTELLKFPKPEGRKEGQKTREELIKELDEFLSDFESYIDGLRDEKQGASPDFILELENFTYTFNNNVVTFWDLIKEILGEERFGILEEIKEAEAKREFEKPCIRFSLSVEEEIKNIFSKEKNRAQKIVEYLEERINKWLESQRRDQV